ncbi:metallophosphoesterase [bacterium]|nr:metallophosphoesterase [bacterium]
MFRPPGRLNTSWESFTSYTQGAVVLAPDTIGNSQTLVEFGWGGGRALFYAMALDKAFQGGNAASQAGAIKLFRNALNYAQMVEDGVAPPIQITPSGAYAYPIRGTVFMDYDRDGIQDAGEPGRAGVGVSDGVDVVLTDATGEYYLPNVGQNPPFVYVSQPADVVKSATTFYQFPRATDTAATRFNFGLWPAQTPLPATQVYFAQVTDVHTANTTDRALQLAAFQDIYAMQPPVDFVVSTGDLVNNGANNSEYQNYLPGVLAANVPFFNVVGNHDVQGGANPVANYRAYFGPDYYSFDHGGIHFVVRNVINTSARQDAWLQQDLAMLAGGRPIVFFQHYPPTAAELAQLDGWNVHSVYTGHWHTEKAVQSATTTSVNSPTAVMGGIDCSPAGFQLVWLGADGSYAKEWRYGRINQKITIVSPPPGGLANQHDFPIVVNIYDSSIRRRRCPGGWKTSARPLRPASWCRSRRGAGPAASNLPATISAIPPSLSPSWTRRDEPGAGRQRSTWT